MVLWQAPVTALTIDDYVGAPKPGTDFKLEEVIGTDAADNKLTEGDRVCTGNGEECFIHHTEKGKSGVVGAPSVSVPIVISPDKEAKPEVQDPEPDTVYVIKYIEVDPADQGTVVTEEETPVPEEEVGEEVIEADGTDLAESESTDFLSLAKSLEDLPAVLDEAFNTQEGAGDFGTGNVFDHRIEEKIDAETGRMLIIWTIVSVGTFLATIFIVRNAMMGRIELNAENAMAMRRKTRTKSLRKAKPSRKTRLLRKARS